MAPKPEFGRVATLTRPDVRSSAKKGLQIPAGSSINTIESNVPPEAFLDPPELNSPTPSSWTICARAGSRLPDALPGAELSHKTCPTSSE